MICNTFKKDIIKTLSKCIKKNMQQFRNITMFIDTKIQYQRVQVVPKLDLHGKCISEQNPEGVLYIILTSWL